LGADQNGYSIEQDGGSGSIEFRLANAYSNTEDGFSIENPSTLASGKFLRCESNGNDGDGFDVNAGTGGQIEVLCSQASANDNQSGAQGRGVVVSNAASQLHIENSHVIDNEGVGINGGNSDLRVISSTVVDNDVNQMGQQIVGSNVSVFTTIGQGSDFVSGDSSPVCGSSPVWAGNLCRSTGMTSCCAGTNPCCAEANIVFDSGIRTYLEIGSPGLDSGNGNPTAFTGLVRIASGQDYFGTDRPQDGDSSGSSLRDVGAFERIPGPPPSTPTRTKTPTYTKTPKPTATPTVTVTKRPTRTLGPSPTPTPTPMLCPPTPCPNGCGGDCNCGGTVSVDEIVFGVNNVLGHVQEPCNECFDADLSGSIMVNDLVAAINNNLHGCPTAPTPTPAGGTGQGGLTITVSVGDASGLPGSSVSVPISVAGGWGFVAAMQVDLVYNASTVDPYFHCEPSSRLAGGQNVAASSISAPAGNRRLRVSLIPSFSAIETFTDGEVVVCTFDLSETAPPGASPIQVQQPGSSDPWGNAFTTSATGGSICVIGGCGCQ
jgi:hypothetical protein